MLAKQSLIIALLCVPFAASADDIIEWSNANGWDQPGTYDTIQTPDINGDGRDDICGRSPAGIVCHTSWPSSNGAILWSDPISGPQWGGSWSEPQYASTIQFPDIDGDGRDDVCGRASAGIRCMLSASGALVSGPAWSDAAGWNSPGTYQTIAFPDINGDGRDDICGRSPEDGIVCHLSVGVYGSVSWSSVIQGPRWIVGWQHDKYASTIGFADVNGDGRDDVCGRGASGMSCFLSNVGPDGYIGNGFSEKVVGPEWSDSAGWYHHRHYSTIRYPDINGDGMADICARSYFGIWCHQSNGHGFPTKIMGPKWSDVEGWNEEKYYATIAYPDMNGDGLDDICARNYFGVRCFLSTPYGFSNKVMNGPGWSVPGGWGNPIYYETINYPDINGDGALDFLGRGSTRISAHLQGGSPDYSQSGHEITLSATGSSQSIRAYVSAPPRQQGDDVLIGGPGSRITFRSSYGILDAINFDDVTLVARGQSVDAPVYYDATASDVTLPLPSLGGFEVLIPNSHAHALKIIAGGQADADDLPLADGRIYLAIGNMDVSPAGSGGLPLDSQEMSNAIFIDPSDPSFLFQASVSASSAFEVNGVEMEFIDVGFGLSENGLVPFTPSLAWPQSLVGGSQQPFYEFSGHIYAKGEFDLKMIPLTLEGTTVINVDPVGLPVDANMVFASNSKLSVAPFSKLKLVELELGRATLQGHMSGSYAQACFTAKPTSNDQLWAPSTSYSDSLSMFDATEIAGCFSTTLSENHFHARGSIVIPGINYDIANATLDYADNAILIKGEVEVLGNNFTLQGNIGSAGVSLAGYNNVSVNVGGAKATGKVTLSLSSAGGASAKFNGSVKFSYIEEVCKIFGFDLICDNVLMWRPSVDVSQSVNLSTGKITVSGVSIKVL